MKESTKTSYLNLGLYAFGGLGLEILILLVESLIYGTGNIGEWSLIQTLGHWTITCIVWSAMSYYLYQRSKTTGFDIMTFKATPNVAKVVGVALMVAICLTISYLSWDHRFKVVAEYASKVKAYGSGGWIAYIFQYSYYWVESILVVLVVAFGQKAGESYWKFEGAKYIPWGGILCGLTWGLVHALTKGSLLVGLEACLCAVLYGCAYLLLDKDVRYAYPVIALMFML